MFSRQLAAEPGTCAQGDTCGSEGVLLVRGYLRGRASSSSIVVPGDPRDLPHLSGSNWKGRPAGTFSDTCVLVLQQGQPGTGTGVCDCPGAEGHLWGGA